MGMAKLKFKKWLNQLIGCAIKGGATAIGAMAGVTAGPALRGKPMDPLSPDQLLDAFIGAAIAGAATFLSKSPTPNFDINGNTEVITKTKHENEPD
jgi:hypothetical protein